MRRKEDEEEEMKPVKTGIEGEEKADRERPDQWGPPAHCPTLSEGGASVDIEDEEGAVAVMEAKAEPMAESWVPSLRMPWQPAWPIF